MHQKESSRFMVNFRFMAHHVKNFRRSISSTLAIADFGNHLFQPTDFFRQNFTFFQSRKIVPEFTCGSR